MKKRKAATRSPWASLHSTFLTSMLMAIVIAAGCLAGDCGIYTQQPGYGPAKDVLVGVNYFAGWWEAPPSKWQSREDGSNWLEEFPERRPILGLYNSQETMDKEIVAAAEHGVDYFMILWYPVAAKTQRNWNTDDRLNDGLTYFANSPEAHRMRFCIEFCNHAPFHVRTLQQWNACIDQWMPAFEHPSYLRIGERLVFKVHNAGGMWEDCGRSESVVKAWLEILRRRVRNAGLGEMVIAAGNAGVTWDDHWVPNAFDFGSDYMEVPERERREEDFRYDWLCHFHIAQRGVRRFDVIPYVPYLGSGWNPKPWVNEKRACYAFPTREQWTRELRRMADDLNALPNMGLPRPDGSVQKTFTIYAWNEFGEGGIVAPTAGEKYMKLEAIRAVFGVKEPPPAHRIH